MRSPPSRRVRYHREKYVIVLAAYLDASHPQPDTQVAAVAGFEAHTSKWEKFEKDWRQFLKDYELKRFHAAEYWAKQGPFRDWSEAKRLAAKAEIDRIIDTHALSPIGFAIEAESFKKWRLKQHHFYPADPYYFCLDKCLNYLICSLVEWPRDEGIAIYCDRDSGRERLSQAIAEWHEDWVRNGERVEGLLITKSAARDRPISTHYVSSVEYPPLQAADILVHGLFQYMGGFLKDGDKAVLPPSLEGISCIPNALVQYADAVELNHTMAIASLFGAGGYLPFAKRHDSEEGQESSA